jgi:ABC-2 type transport system permease protein
MALISFAFMALGLALASGLERAATFQSIGRFTTMPMWFLSGALWPLDKSPEWLKVITLLNPLTYGVDALRTLLIGVNTLDLTLGVAVLTAFTLFMLALGTYLFNRSEA